MGGPLPKFRIAPWDFEEVLGSNTKMCVHALLWVLLCDFLLDGVVCSMLCFVPCFVLCFVLCSALCFVICFVDLLTREGGNVCGSCNSANVADARKSCG